MKYLVRALKYFVYFCVLVVLLIYILRLTGFVSGNVEEMFVNGYKSIPIMLLIVAAFAAVYPMVGFCTRNVRLTGTDEENEPELDRIFREKGYLRLKKDGDTVIYRKNSGFARISKMWEDRITVRRVFGGYSVEGLTKDVVRIITALEYLAQTREQC